MAYDLRDENIIGKGGMGCVYKTVDTQNRTIAVKMMSNQVTCHPEYREMFNAEVDALKLMNHPSVVHINVDPGHGNPWQDKAGNLYLAMEYVEGQTLEKYCRNNPMAPNDAIRVMCMILEAMQYVHSRKKIHRDIKPSNIMLRPNGTICLIDFGIAKDSKVGGGHTVGRIIGTDGYMSPEQANGYNIDHRTDIYSLGCVFFYLLTGRHAIVKGKNDMETVHTILEGVMPMPSKVQTGVPVALDAIFRKAVDKNMMLRYQSAAAFREALEELSGTATPKVTVGRKSDNDIQVDSEYVSGHHLMLRGIAEPVTGGNTRYAIEVIDVGSTNGTGVNGRFLKSASTVVEYNGTSALPDVLMAGRASCRLDWQRVIALLKQRGWKPVASGGNSIGDVQPWESGDTVSGSNTHSGGTLVDDDDEGAGDELGIPLTILSLLFPIVGWVLWGVWKDKYPEKAATAAKMAWIGFTIGFVLNLIVFR